MHRFLAGAVVVGALALPATATAATFTVTTTADTPVGAACTDSAACSLRGAITAANALSTDDTVSVDEGTYHLDNGELSITDGTFLQRAGASGTVTIDADGLSRVLDISADTTLENLTITDGRATDVPGGGAGAEGGGIYAAADIALDGVTLTANHADSAGAGNAAGGGLYMDGQLSVGGGASTFSDNSVTATGADGAGGGAIFLAPGATGNLGGLVLRNNHVTGVDGGAIGGGLASVATGTIHFYGAFISGNTVTASSGIVAGGGVASEDGTFTVGSTRFTGNTSRSTTGTAVGGGMATSTTPTIDAATFDANHVVTNSTSGADAAGGGGLYSATAASIVITNSTFTLNDASAAGSAVAYGGGLLTGFGPTTLTGVTVTANSSTNTATPVDALAGGANVLGPFALTGSILSGNTQGIGPDCLGTPTSGGGNVLFSTADPANPYCQVTLGAHDVLTDAPDLGPPGDHGGGTPTMVPNVTSPALNLYPASGGCFGLTVDQRGSGFTRPQGSACDAGAVEARPATFTAAPAALHFGSVDTGSTSPTQDVTLTNQGDLSAVPALGLGGSDPSAFTRSGCTTAVSAGLTCAVRIGFAPASTGPLSATLTGATPVVALDGTGTTPSGGGGGGTVSSGGGVPQCRDLDASTAFATPVGLTLDCSATVFSWEISTAPAHGTVSAIGPKGQLTYTPEDGFSGDDAFQYIADGGSGSSAPATAVVHVGPGPLVDTTSGSTAKACTARTVTVRLNPRGVHFTRVRVSVAGVLVKPKRTRTVWKATFALKGRPGQKVTVHVSGRRPDGKLVTTTRTLTAC